MLVGSGTGPEDVKVAPTRPVFPVAVDITSAAKSAVVPLPATWKAAGVSPVAVTLNVRDPAAGPLAPG